VEALQRIQAESVAILADDPMEMQIYDDADPTQVVPLTALKAEEQQNKS